MNAVQVNDDDLIYLNVGGQRLTTNRSTLCQVEGSLLAKMFSDGWEDRLKRDKDGAVFFEFNPQYFIIILDYLRIRKVANPDNPAPFPTVPKDQLKTFTSLVEYLGLSGEIVSFHEVLPGEKFDLHGGQVGLEEYRKVVVHDDTEGYGYVLGENVYHKGIVNIELKLESLERSYWMFVGIIKDKTLKTPAFRNLYISCRWPGSYGWILGSDRGEVSKDGTQEPNNTLKGISRQGDIVKLVLDCEAGRLSLHLCPGKQWQIEISKSESWRLSMTLFSPNNKVRII